MQQQLKQKLSADFFAAFEEAPALFCFAPGRVNLIGEYTDLNGGCVLPCALDLGTYCTVSPRSDGKIRLFSANFADFGTVECANSSIEYSAAYGWANYPLGMVCTLQGAGYTPGGFNMAFYGDLPNGAGLSSSASIEVLTGYALNRLFNWDIPLERIALLAQQAENGFVGVSCGVMDQLAVALALEDHALFLDTATLKHEYAPLALSTHSLYIMNTMKRRTLADSKYNQRRAECMGALHAIQHQVNVSSLCALTPAEFLRCSALIADPVQLRRARHAVSEQARVLQARKLLGLGDMQGMGKLMNASHISLRDDFEVTGAELDALVSAAWAQDAVLGARMTGAGFGGCAVALIDTARAEEALCAISKDYLARTGLTAQFYRVNAGGGPRCL